MDWISGTARLDERGRLVLPAELRRRLKLQAGDELLVTEEPDGTLRVAGRRAAAMALIGAAGRGGAGALELLRADRARQLDAERDAGSSVEPVT